MAVVVAGAALALADAAGAALVVGVNDDAGRDPALTSWFYPTMPSIGLKEVTFTLRWDDASPTAIPERIDHGGPQ